MNKMILLSFLLFASCSSYCYKAFLITDAELNKNTDRNNNNDPYEKMILSGHQIKNGNNIILMYRGLFDRGCTDCENYKLVTIEIPKDLLKQNGEINVGCKGCPSAVASIGGIQWLESALIGDAKSGTIIYKYLNDSTLWTNVNLELQLHYVEHDTTTVNDVINCNIIFTKSKTLETQKIPDFPCPRIDK